MRTKLTRVLLSAATIMILLAGCARNAVQTLTDESGKNAEQTLTDRSGQNAGEALYESVLSKRKEDQAYALIDLGGEHPVLLVADGTYDNMDGNQASIAAKVYYVFDEDGNGNVTDLGMVESGGTAYPIAYEKGNHGEAGHILTAGNHFGTVYEIDCENRSLVVRESVRVDYDSDGNASYTEEKDGVEAPIEEQKFYTFYDRLTQARIVDFKR